VFISRRLGASCGMIKCLPSCPMLNFALLWWWLSLIQISTKKM